MGRLKLEKRPFVGLNRGQNSAGPLPGWMNDPILAVFFANGLLGRHSHNELSVSAADPLNLRGILTPDSRVPATSRRTVDLFKR